MKKIIFALILIGMLAVAGKAIITDKKPEAFHIHADFALFLRGERFDFAKPEFMSIEPCTPEETNLIPSAYAHLGEEGLGSAVHLHGNVGHIIHVHRPGITYKDFFNSLDMEFEKGLLVNRNGKETKDNATNTFRYFINDQEVENLTDIEIQSLDRTLITYGPQNRSASSIDRELEALTDEACIYSGLCPKRGEAPKESCGS